MSAGPTLNWRSWAGLVAAPAAWIAHHQTGSDLNFRDCHQGDTTTLVLIGAIALAVALAGGAVSFSAWRQAGASARDGSDRFITALAVMATALLSLTIMVQIGASLILPPCFR